MSAGIFALLCVVGGLGALCRFALDHAIRSRLSTTLPVATMTINLIGSFALGLLAGITAHDHLDGAYAVLGTGFLGGFTTLSTHSVETVRLCLARSWSYAAVNVIGTLVAALLFAWLGLTVGAS